MIDLMKLPAIDAERLAYAEGFTGTATLLARLADAERERDAAHKIIADMRAALEELIAEADDPNGIGHEKSHTYGFNLAREVIERNAEGAEK